MRHRNLSLLIQDHIGWCHPHLERLSHPSVFVIGCRKHEDLRLRFHKRIRPEIGESDRDDALLFRLVLTIKTREPRQLLPADVAPGSLKHQQRRPPFQRDVADHLTGRRHQLKVRGKQQSLAAVPHPNMTAPRYEQSQGEAKKRMPMQRMVDLSPSRLNVNVTLLLKIRDALDRHGMQGRHKALH